MGPDFSLVSVYIRTSSHIKVARGTGAGRNCSKWVKYIYPSQNKERETNWNSNGHRKRDQAPAKQNKSDLHPHHIKHDRWKRGSNQFKVHCLYHMKRSTTRRRGRCHHYPYYRSLILSLTYYILNTHGGTIIILSNPL